ncbi:phosphoinositide 3-kinase regulatory subunit 4-like [Chenopodium quinoa]|uniref:phosphoinositide 3-kinase regulatory subunit 4-like n=1 Tax=Chenopodium quinoa TaxID=63459 RepID=UPI000B7956FC|nr:phosphoinositide 3-kinase regulatory subunit 4-like [Chenopodium quinoa]
MPVAPDAPLKLSMDIFAVGCVIAELFLEGHPLFELSELLAYQRGQYDPSQHLEKIPDPGVRKLILRMIQLNPDERLSAEGFAKPGQQPISSITVAERAGNRTAATEPAAD